MQIRPAIEADRTAILALMRPHDYNRNGLQPACFLVATEDDKVIGIGQIKRHWDGTPELASLVVAEHTRRQGIGAALVQALIKRHISRDQNEQLYLFCLAHLGGYYARFGFQIVPRHRLPWPLATMHLLGNGVGKLMSLIGNQRIQILAMCYHQPA